MIYNTNYNCIYLKEDLFTDTEGYSLTDENKDMIRDDLYRNDFLNVFYLDNYDEDIMGKVFNELHEQFIKFDLFKEYMCKFAKDYNMENNTNLSIIFLFSFDSLYYFHPCICDYLNYGYVTEENINQLKCQIAL